MSETALEEFLILRNLDEPIPEDTFAAATEEAGEVLQDLNDEGVGIPWLKSHVRTQSDEAVVRTLCHYRTENEESIRDHADRARLPVTRIDFHGRTLEYEQT